MPPFWFLRILCYFLFTRRMHRRQRKARLEKQPPYFRFDWRILPLLALTGLVVWVLVSQIAGTQDFQETLVRADWKWVSAAVGLMIVAIVAASYRLKVIYDGLGHQIHLWRATQGILATWPLALITPSRAGDLARAFILRDVCPPLEGSGVVLVERMIDVQSLCLLAIGGSAYAGFWEGMLAALAVLAAEWFVVVFFILSGRYKTLPVLRKKADKIERLVAVFGILKEKPLVFVWVNVFSITSWLMNVFIVAVLLKAFGANTSVLATLATWPLALFVGLLPLTVGGMGTRDAAFVALLHGFGPVNEAAVFAATIGYSAVSLWLFSIVGLPFLIHASTTNAP